jgi:hypothetical protein
MLTREVGTLKEELAAAAKRAERAIAKAKCGAAPPPPGLTALAQNLTSPCCHVGWVCGRRLCPDCTATTAHREP